ncbi:KamA family radical SAM protein [Spirochaetia bacterium 38H-sp]|uniref:KamA family radical SAM protein n=1 Tax=Rarispira pelagica TaxID=3141764 RepID=A0ABU9UBF3_9SPIR
MELPFFVSSYFKRLADDCPELARQVFPSEMENVVLDYEDSDPLCDNRNMPVKRLVHRYDDRVLILVTDRCASYCRFCFRRHFTASGSSDISKEELQDIVGYIARHDNIREILLSGGDPLMLANSKLVSVLSSIRNVRRDVIVRIGSRVPVFLPDRIDESLIDAIRDFKPIWLISHINHPAELTDRASNVLSLFIDAGIPVANQTVLLRDINDNITILEELFSSLLRIGVKPYYLLQGDLAAGTSHFRVPLERSFSLYEKLSCRLSGLALPVFALDLPGGGGKIALSRSSVEYVDDNWYYFRSREGKIYKYPREE